MNGYLEDYANFIDGLLALYGATFEMEWVNLARSLARTMIDEFHEAGAFYDTGRSHEELVTRPRDAYDSATPSGNSVACEVSLRLAHLTGELGVASIANDILSGYARHASENAHGYSRLLCAVDLALGPSAEIVIAGERGGLDTLALLEPLRGEYLPRTFVALAEPDASDNEQIPALEGRTLIDGVAAAYVCVNYACQLPTTDKEIMLRQIREAVKPAGR